MYDVGCSVEGAPAAAPGASAGGGGQEERGAQDLRLHGEREPLLAPEDRVCDRQRHLVHRSAFRVCGSGFGLQASGFRLQMLGFRIQGSSPQHTDGVK